MRLDELFDLLQCPRCRAPLASDLICAECGATHRVEGGLPILVPQHDDAHKERQAAYFDEESDQAFEVTRPHGLPSFHQWLLAEKFRRSISSVWRLVPGATVLTVCGGSGMDAEFLARAGARVVASDISVGAATRAQERAGMYGLSFLSLVADVEALPFRSQSFDVVYVHDGLHHLEEPKRAVAEMARVARTAISITEPALAAATRLAVALGLADETEEAGNAVRRFNLAELTAWLAESGFATIEAARYGMFYRHAPGRPMRLLSKPGIEPSAKAMFSAANAIGGALGNKLAVQAVRR